MWWTLLCHFHETARPSVPASLSWYSWPIEVGGTCLWLWPWTRGKGRGMNSLGVDRGGQRSTGEGVTEVICVWDTVLPQCVWKKILLDDIQRLMVALPGLQFSKYADAIPFEFQHNKVVKNADSSGTRRFFPFSFLSQAVSLGYIKSPHSINPISSYMFGHKEASIGSSGSLLLTSGW